MTLTECQMSRTSPMFVRIPSFYFSLSNLLHPLPPLPDFFWTPICAYRVANLFSPSIFFLWLLNDHFYCYLGLLKVTKIFIFTRAFLYSLRRSFLNAGFWIYPHYLFLLRFNPMTPSVLPPITIFLVGAVLNPKTWIKTAGSCVCVPLVCPSFFLSSVFATVPGGVRSCGHRLFLPERSLVY